MTLRINNAAMRARVMDRGVELAGRVGVADSILTRMKGLLGKKSLPEGEALWLRPCNSVHTFGMRFPIDVIFLDRHQRVVALFRDLRPNRLTIPSFSASSALELPAGTIGRAAVSIGDRVSIQ